MLYCNLIRLKARFWFKHSSYQKFSICLNFNGLVSNSAKTYSSIISGWLRDENHAINKAVVEAEKVIGYPTTYLSLRALLSDELSSIAMHVKKIAASKHPLLSTARGILFDSEHCVQARGLIVLLISKLISGDLKSKRHLDMSEAIKNQRSLAELTEMIYIGFLIHRGIVDRRILLRNKSNSLIEMELGNKMSVLSGDYLFANACVALSELNNSKVVALMSSAIGDMSQGYIILPESGEHSVVTSLKNIPCNLEEWSKTVYLAHGSLLVNACRSSTELINESLRFGETCARFAKHMIFAQQARMDIDRMQNNINGRKTGPLTSEICSLPVVLAAQTNGGQAWIERFFEKIEPKRWKLNRDKLFCTMKQQSDAFNQAEQLSKYHKQKALEMLKQLPDGESKPALCSLTTAFAAA